MCEVQFYRETAKVWLSLSFVIKKMNLIGMSSEPVHVPAICWPADRFIYFAVATVVECHTHTNHIGHHPTHPTNHPVLTCENRWYGSNLFFFGFNSISVNSFVLHVICQNGKGGSGITWEEIVDFNIHKYKKRSHFKVASV